MRIFSISIYTYFLTKFKQIHFEHCIFIKMSEKWLEKGKKNVIVRLFEDFFLNIKKKYGKNVFKCYFPKQFFAEIRHKWWKELKEVPAYEMK